MEVGIDNCQTSMYQKSRPGRLSFPDASSIRGLLRQCRMLYITLSRGILQTRGRGQLRIPLYNFSLCYLELIHRRPVHFPTQIFALRCSSERTLRITIHFHSLMQRISHLSVFATPSATRPLSRFAQVVGRRLEARAC